MPVLFQWLNFFFYHNFRETTVFIFLCFLFIFVLNPPKFVCLPSRLTYSFIAYENSITFDFFIFNTCFYIKFAFITIVAFFFIKIFYYDSIRWAACIKRLKKLCIFDQVVFAFDFNYHEIHWASLYDRIILF